MPLKAGTTRRQPGDEGSYAEEGPDEEGPDEKSLPEESADDENDGVAVSNLVRVDLSGMSDPNSTIKHVRLALMYSIME